MEKNLKIKNTDSSDEDDALPKHCHKFLEMLPEAELENKAAEISGLEKEESEPSLSSSKKRPEASATSSAFELEPHPKHKNRATNKPDSEGSISCVSTKHRDVLGKHCHVLVKMWTKAELENKAAKISGRGKEESEPSLSSSEKRHEASATSSASELEPHPKRKNRATNKPYSEASISSVSTKHRNVLGKHCHVLVKMWTKADLENKAAKISGRGKEESEPSLSSSKKRPGASTTSSASELEPHPKRKKRRGGFSLKKRPKANRFSLKKSPKASAISSASELEAHPKHEERTTDKHDSENSILFASTKHCHESLESSPEADLENKSTKISGREKGKSVPNLLSVKNRPKASAPRRASKGQFKQKLESPKSCSFRYGTDFYITVFKEYLFRLREQHLSPVGIEIELTLENGSEVNKKLVENIVKEALNKREVCLEGEWEKIQDAINKAENQVLEDYRKHRALEEYRKKRALGVNRKRQKKQMGHRSHFDKPKKPTLSGLAASEFQVDKQINVDKSTANYHINENETEPSIAFQPNLSASAFPIPSSMQKHTAYSFDYVDVSETETVAENIETQKPSSTYVKDIDFEVSDKQVSILSEQKGGLSSSEDNREENKLKSPVNASPPPNPPFVDSLTDVDISSESELNVEAQVSIVCAASTESRIHLGSELGSDDESAEDHKLKSPVNASPSSNPPSEDRLPYINISSESELKDETQESVVYTTSTESQFHLDSELQKVDESAEELQVKSPVNASSSNPPSEDCLPYIDISSESELNVESQVSMVCAASTESRIHLGSESRPDDEYTEKYQLKSPVNASPPLNPPSVDSLTNVYISSESELNVESQVSMGCAASTESRIHLGSELGSDDESAEEHKLKSHVNASPHPNPQFIDSSLTFYDLPADFISKAQDIVISTTPTKPISHFRTEMGSVVGSSANKSSDKVSTHVNSASAANTTDNLTDIIVITAVDVACSTEVQTCSDISPSNITSDSKSDYNNEEEKDSSSTSNKSMPDDRRNNEMEILSQVSEKEEVPILDEYELCSDVVKNISSIETDNFTTTQMNEVITSDEKHDGALKITPESEVVTKEDLESPEMDTSFMNGPHDPSVKLAEDIEIKCIEQPFHSYDVLLGKDEEEEFNRPDEEFRSEIPPNIFVTRLIPKAVSVLRSDGLCYLTEPIKTNEEKDGFKSEYSENCSDEGNRISQEVRKAKELQDENREKMKRKTKKKNILTWRGFRINS